MDLDESKEYMINWSTQERIPVRNEIQKEIPEESPETSLESHESEEIRQIREELEFYKSLFVTRRNSCIFNLKIKKMNGKNVWVDRVRDQREDFLKLDRDEEVEEWLKPIRCER
jgi:uncharacterized protein (UPF0297 family)